MKGPMQCTGIALVLVACAPTNLLNPTTPRFLGSYAPAAADSAVQRELRIVSFNIKLSRRVDGAIEVLRHDSLKGADVLSLQEMDEVGVERIARALRLNYAYYPSSIHPIDDKYYGPALLSRWPIERSWKVILPHEGRIWRQRHRDRGGGPHSGRAHPRVRRAPRAQLRISDSDREIRSAPSSRTWLDLRVR